MTPLERRALSRAITRLANADVSEALALDAPPGAHCSLIGVTGPPGVGKSSLISRLALQRVRERDAIAILAIDPTSPISGGAILGDRIRMGELVDDPRIFIRSLATRGSRDGLADNLPLIVDRIVQAGFAEVLLETVGIGQVEYAVRELVDTMLLVLSPGAGDQIQAMKSGIIELPDIFVINKADIPGADQLSAEIKSIVHLRAERTGAWKPLVIRVSVERSQGLAELSDTIEAHHAWRAELGYMPANDRRRREILRGLIARRAGEALKTLSPEAIDGTLGQAFTALLGAMVPAEGRKNG